MRADQSIKAFWDQAADDNPYWYVSSFGSYDAKRNLNDFWASGTDIWRDIKRVAEYAPGPTDTVMEIGCGVGRLTRAIGPEVGRVVALDISDKMLAIARQGNLPNAVFRLASGFTLPDFEDASVDVALAYCVFQHLPSRAALKSYLAEMYRVTKAGGLIAFTLPPRDWWTFLLPALRVRAFLRERLAGSGPKGVYRKAWVGIRPGAATVAGMSPIPLQRRALDAGRILYFGRK